jgi:hypothetical protein
VDFHLYAAIHPRDYDDVALFEGKQPSWNYVAGAQACGLNRRQQDIAGANRDKKL